jgi:hypothetical protein
MSQSHAFRASFGRSLSQRLDRLGSTLADLRDRMRDGIAHAISVAVADAVRAVSHAVLGTRAYRSATNSSSGSSGSRSLWNEPDDSPSKDHFADYHDEDDEDQLDDQSLEKTTEPSRVRNALALGCEGAAWWLRRSAASYALSAVAVGLVCVAAAYLVGNPLAGSILSLAALADVIRSSTSLLASSTS